MEEKKAPPKSDSQLNNSYQNETKMAPEEEFKHTSSTSREKEEALQNKLTQMRKTLDQEICLRNTSEQEIKKKDAIIEELQKSLRLEKCAKMRLVEESGVVQNACNELEERLNELLMQMRRALGNKVLLSGVGGNLLRGKERYILDAFNKTIAQEKQAQSKLQEEFNQQASKKDLMKERWENEREKMEQMLETEICSRNTREKELKAMRTTVDELQKTLKEEQQKRAGLEEQLRQERTVCNALEERLENELEDMQRTLANEISFRSEREKELREKGIVLDELQRTFEEQQLEKTSTEKELNQAKTDCDELKENFENQLAEMQRTLRKEIHLRNSKEQQLKETEAIVEELEKTLGEVQRECNILVVELHQERIDAGEQKEKLEDQLVDTQRTLNIERRLYETRQSKKDSVIDELEHRLSEEEQTRKRVEEELNQARIAHNQVRERLENELANMTRMHGHEVSLRINSERQLSEKETIINQQLRTIGEQQRAFEDELEETRSHYRDEIVTKDAELREHQHVADEQRRQKTALENRLRNLQLQIEEENNRHATTERQLQSALSETQGALAETQRHQPRDWIIQREEVILSERVLGTGGWGNVCEGTFRGCQVAVKEIHAAIISDHNRRLFEREISMASRCRHPNLLQFIGATNDDGSPLFVTELLDTSLRDLLSQRALTQEEIVSLALDVAKGLNYLHLNRPLPIIHRDISSANVLLWRRDEQWRAKLSDFGSANFMRQCTTVNPGAVIYSAPEALTSDAQQSTKVDVYSFGVLLCEMCIRELPDPQEVRNQIRQVANGSLRMLIKCCVKRNPEERPTMSEVINGLEESTRTTGVLSRVRNLLRL